MTALFDAGPSEYHATGEEIALSWRAIAAYVDLTEALCEPWEYRALRDMSVAYVAEKTRGAAMWSKPPSDVKGE